MGAGDQRPTALLGQGLMAPGAEMGSLAMGRVGGSPGEGSGPQQSGRKHHEPFITSSGSFAWCGGVKCLRLELGSLTMLPLFLYAERVWSDLADCI